MMGASRIMEILRCAPQEIDALHFCDGCQPHHNMYVRIPKIKQEIHGFKVTFQQNRTLIDLTDLYQRIC